MLLAHFAFKHMEIFMYFYFIKCLRNNIFIDFITMQTNRLYLKIIFRCVLVFVRSFIRPFYVFIIVFFFFVSYWDRDWDNLILFYIPISLLHIDGPWMHMNTKCGSTYYIRLSKNRLNYSHPVQKSSFTIGRFAFIFSLSCLLCRWKCDFDSEIWLYFNHIHSEQL